MNDPLKENSDSLSRGIFAEENEFPAGLQTNARKMRKNQTPAEKALWEILRDRRTNGLKFRRQHPISRLFILDFYCAELRLAIEVDGDIHSNPDQQLYDASRTSFLNSCGISVARLTNVEVLANPAHAVHRILSKFDNTLTKEFAEGRKRSDAG